MTRLRVITLGCSKNTVDTEHLLAALPPEGFSVVDEGPVDYLLLNTCGFIADAKEESVEAILEAVRSKQSGEAGKVVVFGCLSQRYPEELKAEIPEVDAWFGARDIGEILRYLGVPARSRYIARTDPGHGYAYLKISEGCDRRCSYCAIPYIRGAHRSVPVPDLVEEAEGLARHGVSELILIAQDTSCYGLDIYGRRCLAELIQKLSEIDGVRRIRLHYAYPEGLPDDVLDVMASNPKVCRYLDVPLQHISDRVLSDMHRNSSTAQIEAFITKVRRIVPGIALRTTLMVGHPGEGEEEFHELLDFVRRTRFDRMGAFSYCEEEGTWGAAHLKDEVPEETKRRRYDELMTLQAGISLELNQARVGSEVEVMVDGVLPDGTLVCRSEFESPEVDGEILVRPASDNVSVGSYLKVRITAADEYDLTAACL
ncbi:MAG: 30S ribosomal protein S12 methylthiotransferase RimO [Bacteroidales bacterium]|nr:30S ribosomal protein S12 methylthiotransferase RimO [Bacteroidales bacterium]